MKAWKFSAAPAKIERYHLEYPSAQSSKMVKGEWQVLVLLASCQVTMTSFRSCRTESNQNCTHHEGNLLFSTCSNSTLLRKP
jgi:hypothetical protein